MHRTHRMVLFCGSALFFLPGADAGESKILTNHVGYNATGPKHAVILATANEKFTTCTLNDARDARKVIDIPAQRAGPVQKWRDWDFYTLDFDSFSTEGSYYLFCNSIRSYPFLIQNLLLERNTLSDAVYFFKEERSSGRMDEADRHLPFDGKKTGTLDAHGGWFDATGDYGKHLSHLSFSTYFNPQQIPFTDWCLFKTYEQLNDRNDPDFLQYKRRLLDEAMFGADYLVRVKSPDGSFYRSVGAPGIGKKPEDRRIEKEGTGFAIKTVETKDHFPSGEIKAMEGQFPYEVGYRAGGGVAIAALALASTYDVSGDFSNERYRQTAEDAFAFLEKNNLQFANDGKENIVDDYCALMAATELFKATKDAKYTAAADLRARNLMGRLIVSGDDAHYWRADDGDRPFFHAADAGMPVVSLLNYYEIADEAERKQVLETVRASMEFEMRITDEVTNPFGYGRQLVQSANGGRRTAFFFPHDTETAPWWQGENARLSSMASAARLAATYFKADAAFHDQLQGYAW